MLYHFSIDAWIICYFINTCIKYCITLYSITKTYTPNTQHTPLYVTTLYVTTLHVTTLYVTTLYVTTLYVTTLHVTTLFCNRAISKLTLIFYLQLLYINCCRPVLILTWTYYVQVRHIKQLLIYSLHIAFDIYVYHY